MFQLAAAPPPIAMPGCRDRCGDISIPFPFGIGKNCYMNESFAIECNETVSPARAFISAIKMEVLNISVERAAATVKGPIISSNCSGRENGVPLNLSGTPFVFSYHNVFVAVGCNTQAIMTGPTQALVGCVSSCSDVESKNFCLASPSTLLQVFNLKPEATDDRQGCKLAFLVNQTWFESNISDPFTVQHRDYVPAELGWTMNYNIIDDRSVNCRGFWNISFGSECVCRWGYEGIPYRELGCKDVDECKEESKHTCRGLLKCVNRTGDFGCEINKLYIALIVIGAVVLALSLLMGIWRLYKLVKKRKNIELKKKFFKRNGGLLLQQELRAADDNRLSDILDARVKELCQNEEVILVANLANRCLNFNGKNRPTMREVASQLERIIGLSQKELSIQENCKISKNIMDGASNDWDASKNIMDDAVSTPITGDFDTSRNPSSDGEQPLINTTKC
ncbi:hypothetical protein OIU77_022465 [Salix suchowensis]|uniref:Uncharacterized protein n=1 Tax=Salix suchowensis TaxID=1278906 RepID=A0ABQ9C3Z7_9ROSI|nr:hypothetical protein OIU77_022465 [Salix suchowensis]